MLGDLLPDQPARDNPGVLQAVNVAPYANAWRPVRAFAADTNALSSRCTGAAVLMNAAGSVYNYAGDSTAVYTRSGDTYSSVSTGHTSTRWWFSRYYDTVIAVNGSEGVQTGTFGGALSTAASSPTGAATLTVARNFTIVGNDNTDASRVSWSALGDPTNWTTAEADSQHLDGAGEVMRLIGGEYVTVLCQRGIYRMIYAGPPAQWQFDLVESERGCLYPGMVANVGHLVYYLDSAGFYVFDGNRSRPISSTRLTKWFFDDFDRDQGSLCTAVADTENNLIIFAYPGSGHSGICNRQLIYNYVEDKWSGPVEREVQVLIYTLAASTTVDSFGGSDYLDSGTHSTLPLDDASFGGSNDPTIAAFIDGNYHARDTGATLTALIETGEYAFNPGGYAFCSGFRPVVEGATSGINGAVDYRNTTGGSITRNSLAAINSTTGVVDQRVKARYHRFRLQVTGDYDLIAGGDPILQRGTR